MKHTITRVECTYYSLSVFPNQGSGKPLVQVFWSTSRGSARCKLQWGLEIRLFEIWKHLKSQLFDGWISNSLVLAMAIDIAPTIRKPDHLKSRHFCSNFKWLGFWISDLIRNPDHLHPNLFLTIQIPN